MSRYQGLGPVRPERHRTTRVARASAVLAVAALLTTGCSGGDSSKPVPARAVSQSATPGELSVKVGSTEDLPAVTITGATVRAGSDGEGELAMVVRNDSSIPEHLVMVSTSAATGSTLKVPGSGGNVPPVGVLLPPKSPVTFGTQDGYHVVLHHLNVPSGATEVPVAVLFARLGLVHLQAVTGRS
ncbi:hypothetical protein [Kitasatospora sp. GP82]|uniref:hypothetical protein n=1 Tax=Kitasatospora sp. GP82 TaxID=3035089 RepID=UPI0024765344|nr:hypothetical protein [Kitasatospora sp. GP82]MDH6125079.1 copper(I)-binding protein [Kitasatospora sp. GP82]